MARVGIVCDSTCDLGLEYFAANDVIMVPLKVQIGEETFLDWVDLPPEAFYEKQRTVKEMPTTSQPTPAEFSQAYEEMARRGVEGIVMITLTQALSGTYQSASIAAEEAQVPVHVIDTKRVSQATGLIVKIAVEARDAGLDLAGVKVATEWAVANNTFFFVLDTLEYLVKGGRAGKATGLAAALLNIKPILTFDDDGAIEPFRKVKGLGKAISTLAEHVAEVSKTTPLRVGLLHAVNPDLADQLRQALDDAGTDYTLDGVGAIGAVIGNYAGAGSVGVTYVPAEGP